MKYARVFCVALLAMACFSSALWSEEVTSGKPDGSAIQVLLIDGQNNHNWRETSPVLKQLLEDTGLFEVKVATSPDQGGNMASFRPSLEGIDVIVMNYNGDDWSPEFQKDFEQFVANGGGLVIYHAADNAFPQWKEFNEMCAVGGWGNRDEKSGPYLYWENGKETTSNEPGIGGSHGPQHEFQIEVVREHPITKGLPKKFMHKADELYNRLRGPAKNVQILATAYSPVDKAGTGRNEPQLMVISYGKGRVFHIAYGHAGTHCRSVAFIVPFQRGTQWAATGKVTMPVPEDMPDEDKALTRE